MAAGYKFDTTPQVNIREYVRWETVKRGSKGANLMDNAEGYIFPLTPLKVNLETLEATICVRVKLTDVGKVEYLNGLKAGAFLSDGENTYEVTAINEVDGGYELVGVEGQAGDVLFEVEGAEGKEAKDVPTHLNYATTKISDDETVTILYGAEEIEEHKLFAPLTDADKEALGDRFYFIY